MPRTIVTGDLNPWEECECVEEKMKGIKGAKMRVGREGTKKKEGEGREEKGNFRRRKKRDRICLPLDEIPDPPLVE